MQEETRVRQWWSSVCQFLWTGEGQLWLPAYHSQEDYQGICGYPLRPTLKRIKQKLVPKNDAFFQAKKSPRWHVTMLPFTCTILNRIIKTTWLHRLPLSWDYLLCSPANKKGNVLPNCGVSTYCNYLHSTYCTVYYSNTLT